jgi:hypothetical protein
MCPGVCDLLPGIKARKNLEHQLSKRYAPQHFVVAYYNKNHENTIRPGFLFL